MKKIFFLLLIVSKTNLSSQITQFWKIDGTPGTWTGSNWGTSANGPFSNAWTSGNSVRFTANSAVTFASTNVGNVTVDPGINVTVSQGGTLGGPFVHTYDVGSGSTLTWQTQSFSTASGFGIIKNGAGTWDMGAQNNAFNVTNGGFVLNAGTLIVSGNNSFGGNPTNLSINGGTIQSSGTRAFANPNVVFGGNFCHAGTGNALYSGAINLGSSTRIITNVTTSGSRQYTGIISGNSGSGLTFSGNGVAQFYIGNTGNTFNGPISINGGEIVFNNNGSFGNSTSITIDGGRLSMASMNGSGSTSALTVGIISNTRNIFVGNTSGTAISIIGATGVTTYNGVIANKPSTIGLLAKQGQGVFIVGGLSTYSGETAINNGTIQLNVNGALPNTTTLSLGQSASSNLGVFNLNGLTQTIRGLYSVSGTNATANKNTITTSNAATLIISSASNYTYGVGAAANSGIINGAVTIVKDGSGTQTFGDDNSFTGSTIINNGELRVIPMGTVTSVNLGSSAVILNGGILSTTGINNNGSTNFSTLDVAGTTTISLDSTNLHTLNFAASNNVSWGSNGLLTITNWKGNYSTTPGSSGSKGKIFFGNSSNGLTSAQLSKISIFDGANYYLATLSSNGELISNGLNTSLPIELIEFKANVIGKTVKISWKTFTERNNAYFTIERSMDAKKWETLTVVMGQGFSTTLQNYETVDSYPYKGISYYRLKQTDYNGDYSYSKSVAVELGNNLSKRIIRYVNLLGQEVDENMNGIKLAIYDDGTVEKIISRE